MEEHVPVLHEQTMALKSRRSVRRVVPAGRTDYLKADVKAPRSSLRIR
jgi:hypothetical protein